MLLLCALAASVFLAANASAAQTTAGECVSGGGKKDFNDAHCDKPVTAGTGSFGHVLFANNVKTNVTATNDLTGTASVFSLELKTGGIVTGIECKKASAKGVLTNEAGGKATFGSAEAQFTECEESAPETCKGEPATVAVTTSAQTGPHDLKISTAKKVGPTGEEITFHEENAAGTEMGLKVVPLGESFTTISFTCPMPTTTPIKGVLYATAGRGGAGSSSGATAVFTKSSTIGGLTFDGNPATLEGTFTFRKEGGNPIILTTTE